MKTLGPILSKIVYFRNISELSLLPSTYKKLDLSSWAGRSVFSIFAANSELESHIF